MKIHNYSQRLKALREAKGWSLRHVANAVGVSHNTIKKWETDPEVNESSVAARPSRINALKISKLFDVEPGWLFFGDAKETARSQTIANKLDLLSNQEINQIESMVDLLISTRDNKNGNRF